MSLFASVNNRPSMFEEINAIIWLVNCTYINNEDVCTTISRNLPGILKSTSLVLYGFSFFRNLSIDFTEIHPFCLSPSSRTEEPLIHISFDS